MDIAIGAAIVFATGSKVFRALMRTWCLRKFATFEGSLQNCCAPLPSRALSATVLKTPFVADTAPESPGGIFAPAFWSGVRRIEQPSGEEVRPSTNGF